jgi:hypothetical protein
MKTSAKKYNLHSIRKRFLANWISLGSLKRKRRKPKFYLHLKLTKTVTKSHLKILKILC